MKAGVIGSIALAILVLISAIILTISGRNVRQSELNTSLANAIEQTMEIMYLEHSYDMQNQDEFTADLLGNLIQQFNSDSNITVQILNVDLGEGLFDVQATQKYRHFTGREGIVTARKTVILEEYMDSEHTFHQVLFQNADGSIFRAYTVYEGGKVIEPPAAPTGFIRWKKINADGSEDSTWNGILSEVSVTSNLVFRAVCR